MSDCYSGNMGKINKIDPLGLADPWPGWLPLILASIQIYQWYSSIEHTVKHVFAYCTSAFFLSNSLTVKVQMTTSTTLEEKWKDLRKKGQQMANSSPLLKYNLSNMVTKTGPQRVKREDGHWDVFIYRVQSQHNHFTKCFVRRFNLLAWLLAMEIYHSISVHLSG